MRHHQRILAMSAVAAVAAGGIAGCGSDDSSSKDGGGDGGETIKVMVVSVKSSPVISLEESFQGSQAAADSINAAGGVNGKKIEIVTCDSGFDPNKESACLKKAVSEKVAAVTGAFLFFPGSIKVLEAAKIPYFGGTGSTPGESTSEVSFPLSTQASEDLGLASLLADAGNTSVALINETAPSQSAASVTSDGLALANRSPLTVIKATASQPDYGSAAASVVAKKPTGFTMFQALPDVPKVLKSVRQAGYDGSIGLVSGVLEDSVVKAAGSSIEGVKVSAGVLPISETENPAVKNYLADMKKYEPSATLNSFTTISYAVIQLFAKVAETVDGDVTAASFTEAGNAASTPIDVGLVPPWKGAGTPPLPDAPRVKSYGVALGTVENGQIEIDGGFIDPIARLKGQTR